jgi:hypothetical protein
MIGIILLIISIFLFNIKKFYGSLMLFFLFATNGFQVIPVNWLMAGIPLDKGSDLAILYILYVCVKKFGLIKRILKLNPIFNWCLYLLTFTTIAAFYSYFVLEYPLTNIIQVYRQYIFFISFILFFVIPLPLLKKVFHSLAIITVLQSFLFLLQVALGIIVLLAIDGSENVTTHLEGSYIRYYNSPALLIPTLFYFLFVYKFKNSILFYPIIILLFLTVIAPLHRSAIMAVVASITVYTVLKKGNSIYLAVLSVLIVLGSFINLVNERMNEAYLDITATFSSNLNLQNIDQGDNNLIFRIAHFLERYNYMIQQPFGWLFGIGLISDNSPLAKRLPFRNGLVSEVTGQVVQIDTADLIYSPLLLTLGVVGTILYLLIFVKFLIYFFKNFKYTDYSIIGFLTILNGIFISVAGTEMLSFTFRLTILFLSVIVYKQISLTKKACK